MKKKLRLYVVLLSICMLVGSIGYTNVRADESVATAIITESAVNLKSLKPKFSAKLSDDKEVLKISIAKLDLADGFYVYMKKAGEKKYDRIRTIQKSGQKERSVEIKYLAPGKYYFKVRAFAYSENKTIKSKYSKVVCIEIPNAYSCYRDIITSFDYGDTTTYVIGHKSPDSDTVGSAIAYAYLLNELGIEAEPAVSGSLNNETKYAFEVLGIEAPEIINNAEGKQFVLVDHSTYSHAIDGMKDARIVGIVDHHGIGDVTSGEMINVRSAPVGSTATLIFLACRECGIDVPADIAKVMIVSIMSDTANMKYGVTEADKNAFEELVCISGINDTDSLYEGMTEAKLSYDGMSDWEIFKSDYKEYDVEGVTFGIADVNIFGEEEVRKMADKMLLSMEENYASTGLNMLFAKINNKNSDSSENQTYLVAYGSGAEDVLNEAMGHFDGSKYFVFEGVLSRKAHIVPALTQVILNSVTN